MGRTAEKQPRAKAPVREIGTAPNKVKPLVVRMKGAGENIMLKVWTQDASATTQAIVDLLTAQIK